MPGIVGNVADSVSVHQLADAIMFARIAAAAAYSW
jgi:hypothetical protein